MIEDLEKRLQELWWEKKIPDGLPEWKTVYVYKLKVDWVEKTINIRTVSYSEDEVIWKLKNMWYDGWVKWTIDIVNDDKEIKLYYLK